MILGPPAARAQDSFKPAQFAGLRVGKDTITVAEQRLGKPNKVFRDNAGATWVYYRDVGPAAGKVEIIADSKSGMIDSVVVYPSNLSVEEAKKLFGPGFSVIRYDFDLCLADADGAPLFESNDGQLEYIVYPGLGIAIQLNAGEAESIRFLSKPLGAKKSQCQGKNRKRPN